MIPPSSGLLTFTAPLLNVSIETLSPCIESIFHLLFYFRASIANIDKLPVETIASVFDINFYKWNHPLIQDVVDSKLKSFFIDLQKYLISLKRTNRNSPIQIFNNNFELSKNDSVSSETSNSENLLAQNDPYALETKSIPLCFEIVFYASFTDLINKPLLLEDIKEKEVFEVWVFPLIINFDDHELDWVLPQTKKGTYDLSNSVHKSRSAGEYTRTAISTLKKTQSTEAIDQSRSSEYLYINEELKFNNNEILQSNLRDVLEYITLIAGTKTDHLPLPPNDYPFYKFKIKFLLPPTMSKKYMSYFTYFPGHMYKSQNDYKSPSNKNEYFKKSLKQIFQAIPEFFENPMLRDINYLI